MPAPRQSLAAAGRRFGALLASLLSAYGAVLAGALFLLAGSLWALGLLAEGVATGDPLVETDRDFAGWLHARGSGGLTTTMEVATVLGNLPVLLAVAFGSAYLLARRGRPYEAALVLFAFIGAVVLSAALKEGFERQRPFFAEPRATETTFSFPSGHALVSLAVYGALAWIGFRELGSRPARVGALAGTAVLVLLIGFSRLYLGVHYLSDVLAGLSAGLAWLALCVLALHLHRERESFRRERRSRAQTSR